MGKQKSRENSLQWTFECQKKKIFIKHTIFVSLKWNHAKVSNIEKRKTSNTKTQKKDQNS